MSEIEDPTLTAAFHAKIREVEGTAEQNRTVADRLTMRALSQTVAIDLGGEGDPIPTTIRLPTSAEMEIIQTAQFRKRHAKTVEDADAIEDELAEVLGDICQDESLDAAFWRSGFFGEDATAALIVSAVREVQERVIEARAFRSDPGRGRPLPVRGKVRKNAK